MGEAVGDTFNEGESRISAFWLDGRAYEGESLKWSGVLGEDEFGETAG